MIYAMKHFCSCFLSMCSMVIMFEQIVGISSNDKDLSSCDCSIYRRKFTEDDIKLTRAYSTSTVPTQRVTTSHTTYITRPTTVTPQYFAKVSSMFPSSPTTTPNSRTSVSTTSSSIPSTSLRSTTSSTTPSTKFWTPSTSPSSYTLATFSSSPSSTWRSTVVYSIIFKYSTVSSTTDMRTRIVSSSTSRPTREYTSTTDKIKMRTTTMMRLHRKIQKNIQTSKDNKEILAKCMDYCRSRNNLLDPAIGGYRGIPIEEVPVTIDLTVTVTADYTPGLDDPASSVYQSVVTHLNNLLVTLYNSTTGFQSVRIRGLRKGSILCDYSISLLLRGNSSAVHDVLLAIGSVTWEHTYLPKEFGVIDVESTRDIQGRQLKIVVQQFKDMCSLVESECMKLGRICINDQHHGLAMCVPPCTSVQIRRLDTSCVGGQCYLDISGRPKCFCGSGATCQTTHGISALYVLPAVGVGLTVLLCLVIGLVIYLHSKHKSDSRSLKHTGKDIKVFVIDEIVGLKFNNGKIGNEMI